jgi:hypothetical protein
MQEIQLLRPYAGPCQGWGRGFESPRPLQDRQWVSRDLRGRRQDWQPYGSQEAAEMRFDERLSRRCACGEAGEPRLHPMVRMQRRMRLAGVAVGDKILMRSMEVRRQRGRCVRSQTIWQRAARLVP